MFSDVALGGWTRRALRSGASAHRSVRLIAAAGFALFIRPGVARKLLDEVFPRGHCAWRRPGDQCRAAHHHCDERRRRDAGPASRPASTTLSLVPPDYSRSRSSASSCCKSFAHRFESSLRRIPLPPATSAALSSPAIQLRRHNIPADLDPCSSRGRPPSDRLVFRLRLPRTHDPQRRDSPF